MNEEQEEQIEAFLDNLRKEMKDARQLNVEIRRGTTSAYNGDYIPSITDNGTRTITIKINGGAVDYK